MLGFFAIQTVSILLIGMRGLISDWMSIVLGNTLALAGCILGT